MDIQLENKMENKIKEYIEYHKKNGISMTWDQIALKCGFTSRQTLQRVMQSQNPTILSLLKVSIGLNINLFDLIHYESSK
jgi:DNA-binding phage protein